MIYTAAFAAAYLTILMKVFQQKNVVGNHYKAVFGTSLVLAICEASIVLLVVHNGIYTALATGVGSGLGAISGMFLHNKFMKREPARG